jgi:hypothetical protein
VNPCVCATNTRSRNFVGYASCEARLNLICILFGFSLKTVFKMFSSLHILKCSFSCGVRDVSHCLCAMMTVNSTSRGLSATGSFTWYEYYIDVRTVWFATDFNVFSFRLLSRSFVLLEITEEVNSDKNLWLLHSFDTFNCVEMIINTKLIIVKPCGVFLCIFWACTDRTTDL